MSQDTASRPHEDVAKGGEWWAEHGWALGFRPVSLIILAILASSALDALLRWVGLPGLPGP